MRKPLAQRVEVIKRYIFFMRRHIDRYIYIQAINCAGDGDSEDEGYDFITCLGVVFAGSWTACA